MVRRAERCEFEDCDRRAVGEAHAQWTLVDFVAYRMCLEHAHAALQILAARRVDGQAAADVWMRYWEPLGEVDDTA